MPADPSNIGRFVAHDGERLMLGRSLRFAAGIPPRANVAAAPRIDQALRQRRQQRAQQRHLYLVHAQVHRELTPEDAEFGGVAAGL
ncbi:MAG TPA: hypothetical protein VGM17_07085, partial [Rhizomicrobium sp.]